MRMPNGFGSVVKLGGKRRKPFAVRITTGWSDEGKQKYKYLGYYERKSDAVTALSDFNKNPYDISAANATFSEVYEKWTDEHFKKISAQTAKNYVSMAKQLAPIADLKIRSIKVAHLQELIDGIQAASRTKKLILNLVKQVFEYAMKHEIISKDYSQFVQIQESTANKKVRKIFTADEIEKLWDHVGVREFVEIPLILIYTGMRINELLDAKKSNVHISERYIQAGSKTKAGKGENGEGRIIPIHPRILPLVEKLMQADGEYLIMSKRGKKMQYTFFSQDTFKKMMSALEMQHTTHDCRATFASMIDRTDANKLAVKRILGHSDANITEHYTYKEIADLLQAVDKI